MAWSIAYTRFTEEKRDSSNPIIKYLKSASTNFVIALFVFVAIAFVCSTISSETAYADELGDSFIVAAAQQDRSYVVEPTNIEYQEGETIQQALERADLGFEFSQMGTVESINGIKPSAGMYLYYFTDYESQESAMLSEIPASSIRALFISSADVGAISQGHVNLLEEVRAFMLRSKAGEGLANYSDAITAYGRCIQALPSANDGQAESLAADLASAIADYDAIMSGPKRTVTFNVKLSGSSYNDAKVKLTDLYGNVTKANRTAAGVYSAQVVDGMYSYEVFDESGLDGVRCSFTAVSSAVQINAEIPSVEWYGAISLRVKSNASAFCSLDGTSVSNRKEQTVRNIVPDVVMAMTDLAVYAEAPSAISSNVNQYPLYVIYGGKDGKDREEQIAYKSNTYCPAYLVEPGPEGTEFTYEVRHTLDVGFTTQVEICNATIVRSATLEGISVKDGDAETLSGFAPYTNSFDVYTASDELSFAPKPYGSIDQGYAATVNGAHATMDAPVKVSISDSARTTPQEVVVKVALGGSASSVTAYKVKVHKVDASTVVLSHGSGVSVEVRNDAKAIMSPIDETGTSATYRLLEGHQYEYTATLERYYHSICKFTAAEGLIVNVVKPDTIPVLDKKSFELGRDNLWLSGSNPKPLFPIDERAETEAGGTEKLRHEPRFIIPDYWSSQVWIRAYLTADAVTSQTASQTYSYSLEYSTQDKGVKRSYTIVPDVVGDTLRISRALDKFVTSSGYENTVKFTIITDEEDGVTFAQDYTVTAVRQLTLPNVSLAAVGGGTLKIMTAESADSENPVFGFDRDVRDYVAVVPAGTNEVMARFTFPSPVSSSNLAQGGYTVAIDGDQFAYASGATRSKHVDLDVSQHEQVIMVTVQHEDTLATDTTYRIVVRQMPKVEVAFDVFPHDATVTVTDVITGQRVNANNDGYFELISGYDYAYSVAARGYVGESDHFMAYDGLRMSVELAAAPVNPAIDTDMGAHWPYFRADENNNAVIRAKTPIPDADGTETSSASGSDGSDNTSNNPLLYWATRVGSGYDSGGAGCPIIVDGYLYTYAGNKIFKLDTITGEVVATGTMSGTSSFAITPMTYAEGTVFVALSNGRVQAFNAATLESLWIYTSPNGGQPNCPITYHDGCVYTGFWNWSNVCDFVCLTVTDEDPSVAGEDKVALWTYPHEGGFYWAGAWAGNDCVIVGSDNASISSGLGSLQDGNASGPLLSLEASTGRLIDTLSDYSNGANVGNIRSTIVYDPQTDRFYYSGSAGYLCSVEVNDDGTFVHSTAQAIALINNASDGAISATSTPVVYNGRAYVGADHGAYNAYDGQTINVVNLPTQTVAYVVGMQGRAQASGLLTTGYVDEDGYLYIYYFDNYTPGKLRCFKDKPGQTTPKGVGNEQGPSNVANVVFRPQGAQAQYCICSPIADEHGTIYFKNDSSYTMALGFPITKLEVTEQPTVTEYGVGESFDPAGMKVVATYSNGTTRDVTKYVQCSKEAFDKEGIVDVPIVFPYTMYQSGASGEDAGQAPDYNYEKPSTTVQVTVGTAVAPRLTTVKLPIARAVDTAEGTETPYEAKLQATGAPRDFTWTLTGNLPDGLTFDSETATISGTPKAKTGGAYPINVSVSNGVGSPATVQYVLEVYERPSVEGTSKEIPMRAGEQFSYQVKATGYPQPLTYGVIDGWLHPQGWASHTPEGLSLDPETGMITGTPTESGLFRMRVYAGNEVGNSIPFNFKLSVSDALTILTKSLPEGVVGLQYEEELQVDGYPDPLWSWRASEGSQLPEGLELDEASGTITGVPIAAGDYEVVVTAQNSEGTAEKEFILKVSESETAPHLVTNELPNAAIGELYNASLEVSGAPKPTVTVAGLPDGLQYDAKSRAITGTPVREGTYQVQVSATNQEGTCIDEIALLVAVAPKIENEVLGSETGESETGFILAGEEVSLPVMVSGSPKPNVTVAGLPYGLIYDAETGIISGTPENEDEKGATVTVTAVNGVGTAVERAYTLCVYSVPRVSDSEWQTARYGQAYEQDLGIVGTPKPRVIVAGLASGLRYDKDKGAIVGTPTMKGTFNVAIQVSNAAGSEHVEKTLIVGAPPTIGVYALADAIEGRSYTMPLKVSGEPKPIVSVDGLPEGLSYEAADGVISGKTDAIGRHSVTVTASNGVGDGVEHIFTLVVREDFTLATDGVTNAYTDEDYEARLVFSHEVKNESVQVELPSGMTWDVQGRELVIHGRAPSRPGDYNCSVNAMSERGTALSATFTLIVESAYQPVSFGMDEYSVMPWTVGTWNSIDLANALQAEWRGGYEPVFSVAVGSELPDGVGLSEEGVLSGTPKMTGAYTFAINCTNSDDGAPAVALISMDVAGGPGEKAPTVPQGRVGSAYKTTISLGGYPSPTYTWKAAMGSSLVPGLTLDAGTGLIEGTPSRPGIYNVIVTATNNYGSQSVHVSFVVKTSIANAKIDPIATQTYSGKAVKPNVIVYEPSFSSSASSSTSGLVAGSLNKKLIEGTDYKLSYEKNVNAGTATITVKGAGVYDGSKTCTFEIAKAKQTLSVKASKKSFNIKYKKVRNKKQVTKASVKVTGAQGKVTYAKVKVNKKKMAKKFTVNKNNGKITVKKGVKKGTYKITIRVTAAGTNNYETAKSSVVVKVVVK